MNFSFDWFTPAIPVLNKVLHPLKGRGHVRALEIGCFEGRSTVWFLENILTEPGSNIVCIDTFEGGEDHKRAGLDFGSVEERFRENLRDYQRQVSLRVGSSCYLLPLIIATGKPFDFVYIDGSHLASDVLSDAIFSWYLLPIGGYLIFDDYGWGKEGGWLPHETPGPAIDAFLACFEGHYELLHKEYHVAVRKIKA